MITTSFRKTDNQTVIFCSKWPQLSIKGLYNLTMICGVSIFSISSCVELSLLKISNKIQNYGEFSNVFYELRNEKNNHF